MSFYYLLSLGSNIGNKKVNIELALEKIREFGSEIIKLSSFYETAPVDFLLQEDFLNICAIISSEQKPTEILKKFKEIEKLMGRIKIIEKGPRVIDIDIIFWSGGIFESEELTIPHQSYLKRLFVIVPAIEVIEKTAFFIQYLDLLKSSLKNQNIKAQIIEKI